MFSAFVLHNQLLLRDKRKILLADGLDHTFLLFPPQTPSLLPPVWVSLFCWPVLPVRLVALRPAHLVRRVRLRFLRRLALALGSSVWDVLQSLLGFGFFVGYRGFPADFGDGERL